MTDQEVVKQKWREAWAEDVCGFHKIWSNAEKGLYLGGHCLAEDAWAAAAKRIQEPGA